MEYQWGQNINVSMGSYQWGQSKLILGCFNQYRSGEKFYKEHHDLTAEIAGKWHLRLEDISWIMRSSNESIGHRANLGNTKSDNG